MLYAWIGFLIFLELYGIGVALLEKKANNHLFWLCLIPFVAFFFVDKRLHGFTIIIIKIKSLLFTMILMSLIALGACLIIKWGNARFPIEASEPLAELMLVPIGFALFGAWVSLARTSSDLLFHFHFEFKCDLLVCLLIIPIPFLFIIDALLPRKEKAI